MLAREGEVTMGEAESGCERRRAMRVPVRGQVVLHGDVGPLHGTLENLSHSGALVSLASAPTELEPKMEGAGVTPAPVINLELRLVDGTGWVTARAVRAEPSTRGARIAVVFDRVEPAMRASIDASITSALTAARRRPILVIDDQHGRRSQLMAALAKEGMTPLAPATPLEAIDLLTRAQLHVSVCLLAPGFGVPSTDLAMILSDSFPWVTTTEITDDLDGTLGRVIEAWAQTPVARLGAAIV
jgi:CheY-like chemotaxis protein